MKWQPQICYVDPAPLKQQGMINYKSFKHRLREQEYLRSLSNKIYSVIDEVIAIDIETGCWINPRTNPNRYPMIYIGTKKLGLHRVMLYIETDAIDGKPLACHTCDNPRCCNPSHLYWGDTQDNVTDRNNRPKFVSKPCVNCSNIYEGYANSRYCSSVCGKAYRKENGVAPKQ